MTTTAAKPGVRERQRQLLAALDAAQRELVSVTTSLAGLHATLIAVLAQRGGEVTITPGTMAQVTGTKLGFSMQPGPGEGEMTLRVVTEEDVEDAEDSAAAREALAEEGAVRVTLTDQHDSIDNVLDANGERVD